MRYALDLLLSTFVALLINFISNYLFPHVERRRKIIFSLLVAALLFLLGLNFLPSDQSLSETVEGIRLSIEGRQNQATNIGNNSSGNTVVNAPSGVVNIILPTPLVPEIPKPGIQRAPAPIPTPLRGPRFSRIGIADFEDRSAGKITVIVDIAAHIHRELNQRIDKANLPIELYLLQRTVNENEAVSVGKKYGCTLLIWGWYDEVSINARVEKLSSHNGCRPTEELKDISIDTLNDFKLTAQKNVPLQATYLALLALSNDRYAKGEDDQALIYVDEALAGFTNCSPSTSGISAGFRFRGDIYRAKNLYAGAIENYSCAIQIFPDEPANFYNRGLARRNKGDELGAIADFDKVINLYGQALSNANAKVKEILRIRGFAFLNTSNYSKAIADFLAVVESSPQDATAHRDLGYAYRLANDTEKAIAELKKAVELKPDDADALTNLSIVYKTINKDLDALEMLNRAISANEDYAPALRRRGWIYHNQKDYAKAILDFKKVTEVYDKDSVAYRDLGYVYRINDQLDLAIENFNQAIYLDNNDADAYLNRGLAYKKGGYKQEAINDLQHAKELVKPGHWIFQLAAQALDEIKTN